MTSQECEYGRGSESEQTDSGTDLHCSAILFEGAMRAHSDTFYCTHQDQPSRDADAGQTFPHGRETRDRDMASGKWCCNPHADCYREAQHKVDTHHGANGLHHGVGLTAAAQPRNSLYVGIAETGSDDATGADHSSSDHPQAIL
jgi:hypothetical protein